MEFMQMKIVDWDEATMSMIVQYSSDINFTDIDQTPAVAVQPLSLFQNANDNVQEVLKKVVSMGISVCEERARREKANIDPNNVEFFRNLKGQILQYQIDTLVSSNLDEDVLDETNRTLQSLQL
jgi:hypothetical protein